MLPVAGRTDLTDAEIANFNRRSEWRVMEVGGMKRLERVFKFKNFVQDDGVCEHDRRDREHQNIIRARGRGGKVTVNWWTHKICACTKTISSWRSSG